MIDSEAPTTEVITENDIIYNILARRNGDEEGNEQESDEENKEDIPPRNLKFEMLKNVFFFYYANAHAEQVLGMLRYASRHIEGRMSCFVTWFTYFYVIKRTNT